MTTISHFRQPLDRRLFQELETGRNRAIGWGRKSDSYGFLNTRMPCLTCPHRLTIPSLVRPWSK